MEVHVNQPLIRWATSFVPRALCQRGNKLALQSASRKKPRAGVELCRAAWFNIEVEGRAGAVCAERMEQRALAGAFLLLAVFRALVPRLILGATLLFIFAASIHQLAASRGMGTLRWTYLSGFLAALCGGYFGAGLGLVLMSLIVLDSEKNFRAALVLTNCASARPEAKSISEME
ncbi:hypothetical protein IB238_21565 [Rhizobium sp. ARZ01]|uniref:hypothetical protein n=1 Tax=Rhizobium sp. ARZ01 TaxID=2769313 RepID=UPI00177BBF43|nr:hypothetical protein [Rhizobium sp. ARZ01]MBD9375214.1 hypothetical protein [Rhizobium sp. ARZ01]